MIVGLLLSVMLWCIAGGSPTKASKLNVNAPVWIGSPSKAPASGAGLSPVRTSSACSTIPAVSVEVRTFGHAMKARSPCRVFCILEKPDSRQRSLQSSQPVMQGLSPVRTSSATSTIPAVAIDVSLIQVTAALLLNLHDLTVTAALSVGLTRVAWEDDRHICTLHIAAR